MYFVLINSMARFIYLFQSNQSCGNLATLIWKTENTDANKGLAIRKKLNADFILISGVSATNLAAKMSPRLTYLYFLRSPN